MKDKAAFGVGMELKIGLPHFSSVGGGYWLTLPLDLTDEQLEKAFERAEELRKRCREREELWIEEDILEAKALRKRLRSEKEIE